MTADPDTYTVAEAAKVLGRSPKRVRQIIAEGKLQTVPGSAPARVPAVAVLQLRDSLRATARTGPQSPATGLTAEDVIALVERLTSKALEASAEERARADSARDRAEELLTAALAAERQRADALATELQELRDTLAAPPAPTQEAQRRRWFRRTP